MRGATYKKSLRRGRRHRLWGLLVGLIALLPLLALLWHLESAPQAMAIVAARAPTVYAPTQTRAALPQGRVYFVERRAEGYRLMASDLPGASIPLALLPDHFGQSSTDAVTKLVLAPGGAYLAIDARRDHGSAVWIVPTATGAIHATPPDAIGNFLNWLPDGRHFLFRPFLPVGPVAAEWKPGLWIVDATSGNHENVPLPGNAPNTQAIDAVATPDGAGLIVSLTSGLGAGSTVWRMTNTGADSRKLWSLPATVGLFAWSPDGQHLAYETLLDAAIPYRPAGLWLYSPTDDTRRQIAEADGGHGFIPAWSPDSQRLAFVARLNPTDGRANALAGQLISGIHTVALTDGTETPIAGPTQTGLPRNINPSWRADGTLLFGALAASAEGGAALGRASLWQAKTANNARFTAQTINNTLSNSSGLFAVVP